jgi:hypothetical protein
MDASVLDCALIASVADRLHAVHYRTVGTGCFQAGALDGHVAPSPGRCPIARLKGSGFEIDVRENHVEGCGEALPMLDPLVMPIHVTPAGLLTTTAGAADAQQTYRRPVCPGPARHNGKSRG